MDKDILIQIIVCVSIFILIIVIYYFNIFNLYRLKIKRSAYLDIQPHIKLMSRDNERLFLINPERVVIYNPGDVIYYYFEGGVSQRVCPDKEYAVVRISGTDIKMINQSGVYNVACTGISSLSLLNNFSETVSQQNIPIADARFTLLDILNFLIANGYASVA
uniref:PxGV-Torf69 protein n=1 Tax=Plutella xylostella granulovirus TaxID=98383 RepID=A0A142DWR4_9BBAC|nr:PxGV-Torf69 protein [Plutella xylostella granulovirus]